MTKFGFVSFVVSAVVAFLDFQLAQNY